MKNIFLITLGLLVTCSVFAQKKKKFYDSLGNETTFELYWSQIVGGRYKSVYDKKTNSKTLARTTEKEFKDELSKTEKRIIKKTKIGTEFPAFKLPDINNNFFDKKELKGKVIVVNFWFIGCGPCEMERPELNGLAKVYEKNENVIFISFAKNNADQLRSFLIEHPVSYLIFPTGKDEITKTFGVENYPVNIIIDKDGKYFLNSAGTGIGISYILKREIDSALNN